MSQSQRSCLMYEIVFGAQECKPPWPSDPGALEVSPKGAVCTLLLWWGRDCCWHSGRQAQHLQPGWLQGLIMISAAVLLGGYDPIQLSMRPGHYCGHAGEWIHFPVGCEVQLRGSVMQSSNWSMTPGINSLEEWFQNGVHQCWHQQNRMRLQKWLPMLSQVPGEGPCCLLPLQQALPD